MCVCVCAGVYAHSLHVAYVCICRMYHESGDRWGVDRLSVEKQVGGVPLSLSLSLSLYLLIFHSHSLARSLLSAPLKVTATLRKFGRYMIPGAQG